jgi:acetyl-CoA acetyltransferases
MRSVAIVEAARTPFGRLGGRLRNYSAVELGSHAAQAVLQRSGISPDEVDETFFGTAMLAGGTSVAARQINFKIGLPDHTPSLTLDRACCSGMTSVALGTLKIRAEDCHIVLAGGIESCSNTPFLMRGIRGGKRLGDFDVEDPLQIRNPITGQSIAGVTGTQALKFGVDRKQQDEWALRSHQRYFEAYDKGLYQDEIIGLEDAVGELCNIDESPRRNSSLEKLAALSPVYGGPTVTAGNAPGLNDGATAVLLMAAEHARARQLPVMAEIISYAQMSGPLDSSVYMPGKAILEALKKASLSLDDLKRIEINEAFAAMPLVSTLHMAGGDIQSAERLREITNVNGGSVAIGHPTGASGARVIMALLRELQRAGGGYGAAAICGGYGQADAVILKV